jgi:hypothetical protein
LNPSKRSLKQSIHANLRPPEPVLQKSFFWEETLNQLNKLPILRNNPSNIGVLKINAALALEKGW